MDIVEVTLINMCLPEIFVKKHKFKTVFAIYIYQFLLSTFDSNCFSDWSRPPEKKNLSISYMLRISYIKFVKDFLNKFTVSRKSLIDMKCLPKQKK